MMIISVAGRWIAMWWQFNKVCWPYKKWFGLALIALGVIMLLLFVPIKIWLALVGAIFIIAGAIISKC